MPIKSTYRRGNYEEIITSQKNTTTPEDIIDIKSAPRTLARRKGYVLVGSKLTATQLLYRVELKNPILAEKKSACFSLCLSEELGLWFVACGSCSHC